MYRHCRFASLVYVTEIADMLYLFVLNLQHKRENSGDECVIFRQFTFNFLMNRVIIWKQALLSGASCRSCPTQREKMFSLDLQ